MDTSEDILQQASPGLIPGSGTARAAKATRLSPSFISWLQAGPMMLVFLAFFLIPLVFVVIVSFWDYNEYQLLPAFSGRGYTDTFEGCIAQLPDLCTIAKTYLKTLKLCFLVWVITLFIGFWVAYFLAFYIRSAATQTVLFLICTVPFLTSNIIRMISWIPVLGRNGLINSALVQAGLVPQPVEWLLYSDFAVVLAMVHLYTLFMVTPIFNTLMRIDRSLIEAARDAGANAWQIMWNVILPLAKPGMAIGTIFVVTLVMADFSTVQVMSGGQSASVALMMKNQMSLLQYPAAAANAVVLLVLVLLLVGGILRIVDIRKEL